MRVLSRQVDNGWPRPHFAVLAILLLAVNLRPAITSVGPVVRAVGKSLGFSIVAYGLIGGLPLVLFGVAATLILLFRRTVPVQWLIMGGLVTLTAGIVGRSHSGNTMTFWLFTAIIASSIAVINVLMPTLVNSWLPAHRANVTALYVAIIGIFGGLGGTSSAVLNGSLGWSWGKTLYGWAGVSLFTAVIWLMTTTRFFRASSAPAGLSLPQSDTEASAALKQRRLRIPTSNLPLALFMGLHSGLGYIILTWLPAIESDLNFDPLVVGTHLFIFKGASVIGNLLTPPLLRRARRLRGLAMGTGVVVTVSSSLIFFWPDVMIIWLSLLGLVNGMSFVTVLSMVAGMGDHQAVAKISSRVQSIAYVLSGLLVMAAGIVQGAGTMLVIGLIGVVGLLTIVVSSYLSRNSLKTV